MDNSKIGQFIREARNKKGVTQAGLAEKLHVTNKAVSKWERGLSLPDIELWEPLAKELNISVLELFHGDFIEKENIETVSVAAEEAISAARISQKNKICRYKILCAGLIFGMVTALTICILAKLFFYNEAGEWMASVVVDEVHGKVLEVHGESANPAYNQGTYEIIWDEDIVITDYSEQHTYSISDINETAHLRVFYTGRRKLENHTAIEHVYKLYIMTEPL